MPTTSYRVVTNLAQAPTSKPENGIRSNSSAHAGGGGSSELDRKNLEIAELKKVIQELKIAGQKKDDDIR